jgi:hypothetical protein
VLHSTLATDCGRAAILRRSSALHEKGLSRGHRQPQRAAYDVTNWVGADVTMGGAAAHIILKIKTKNPIELGDFVAEFTSVASQYDKFIRENHPDLGPEARIYVKQIKKGSIIAELLPFVPFAMFAPQIVSSIEQVNAV